MRESMNGRLRFSPENQGEISSGRWKHFLFCAVLFVHTAVFLLPLLWHFFREWLTPPPPKVLEVTLVSEPSSDPHSSRGTRASARKSRTASSEDVPVPPGKIEDISDKIPDTPDLPDLSKIKRKPKPKPKPKKTVSPRKPVKKTPAPVTAPARTTPRKPEKPVKKDMVEEIRKWRARQGGKTVKTVKPSSSRSGNSEAQTRNRLAKDLEGMIGNGGTADWGSGGVYDSYIPILIDFIQREWKRFAPPDMGTKVSVPLYFDIDGRGAILQSYVKKRSGIPVLDSAVSGMLRSMRRLPAPPDGKRCQFTINLRIGEE